MAQRLIRTPDQRLRVFISSTLQEVADERAAARDAVTRLHLSPVMFELGARPHPPRDLYRAYLDQSHIFVGIYWQRYGWVAPSETVSGLEDEYRLSGDKPRLIYIKSPSPDREPRLMDLLDDIKATASYKYFKTTAELGELIENDLMLLLTERFEPPLAESPPSGAVVAPSNLPAALNSFIGREDELREVIARLQRVRLLTLTGSGGTGKTRLALRASTDLALQFNEGIYFVDLTSIRETDAALAAIVRAAGLRETGDRPLIEDLRAQIGTRQMLLVLDNFEQVIVAAPAMAELLRDCPELKLLVTSREPLRVGGEQVFPVSPLSLPAGERRRLSTHDLAKSEAVQLFVDRAQAVRPDFQLDDENVQAVAELCVHLDGLPLAIELAAARSRLFSPQMMIERLGNRLQLLRGGARDLPQRQQTLRDTIDWSYELLDEGERRVFRVLGAFSGSSLAAVEAVAGALSGSGGSSEDILDVVSSLVDKSLVRQAYDASAACRLSMLETIREFAVMRLDDDRGLAARARRAHATYFAELTERQSAQLTGDHAEMPSDALAVDIENIQAAWRYWVAKVDLEQMGRFTDGLWLLYDARGWYQATVALANDMLSCLSVAPSSPERLRDQITLQMSLARVLLTLKGYTPEVEEAYARALELSDGESETTHVLPVLRALSSYYLFRADFAKGAEIGEQLLHLAERNKDPGMRAEGHLVLGACRAMASELRLGLEHLETGIALIEQNPPSWHRFRAGNHPAVVCLATSALVLWMMGFPDRALVRAGEAMAMARTLSHPATMAYAQFHAGLLHFWRGENERALERARSVLELAEQHEFQIWMAVGSCLEGAALAGMGSVDDGLRSMQRGVDTYRGLRTPPVFWPMLLYLQARVYGLAGRPADGLVLINEALEGASQGSSNGLAPELLQVKGELLLAGSPENAAEAEALFQEAMQIAADEDAAMLRLRAALSLSGLWRDQGKQQEARTLLSGARGNFTEGFAIPDLIEADALLRTLS